VLEIIEQWREAAYSEVKSLNLRENLFNVECSEVQWSEVKWTKQSEMEWGEVKCSMGGGRVVSDEKWKIGVKSRVN